MCSACSRHQRVCIYLADQCTDHTSPRTALQDLTLDGKTRISGPASPYTYEPLEAISHDRRRVLELLLLHHFTTQTASTFPGQHVAVTTQLWAVEAVHTAFEHSFLLNVILAISSLHAALVPMNRPGVHHDFDFARVHRIYLSLAVREQRGALSDINKSNANALGHASLMMNLIAIRLLPDQMETEPYTPPVQWLSMSNSIYTIFQATLPFLQAGTIADYIKSTSGPDFQNPVDVFDYTYAEPFRAIFDFDDGSEIIDEDTRSVYDQAIAYISRVHQAILKPELPHQICRRVMGLGPLLPRRFIALVAERRPRALTVIAYHMAMSKYVEQYWWFQGTAERDVYGIQNLLPAKWQWALEWPLHILATCPTRAAWSGRTGAG